MKKVKNIPTYYTFPGTKIFRDTTALPFKKGGPINTSGPVAEPTPPIPITVENLNNIYPAFRNLENVVLTPDPTYTRDKTGLGDIEYISPDRGAEPIRYPTGYELNPPQPGAHNIVYNPDSTTIENVKLDLFSHGLRTSDPTYQKYLAEFTKAYKKAYGKTMDHWYKQDSEQGYAEDGREQWDDNYIDGVLRGIFHGGTMSEKLNDRYNPTEEADTILDHPELIEKIGQIRTYLETPQLDYLQKSLQLPATFADGGPLHDRDLNGKLLNSTYAPALGNMFREGGPFGEDKGSFDYAQSVYAPELGNYYPNGGKLLEQGQIYTYSDRPGSYYKIGENNTILIKNESTGWKYVPIKDPTGERTQNLIAGLESGLTKPYQSQADLQYHNLNDTINRGTAAESTNVVSMNSLPMFNPMQLNYDVKYNQRVADQNKLVQAYSPEKPYAIVDKTADSIFYFNPNGSPIAGEAVITGASNNDIDRGLSMKDWMEKTGNTSHDAYFEYLKSIKAQTTPSGAYTLGSLRTNTAQDPSLIGSTINNLFRPERAEFIRDSRIKDYGEQQKMFTLIDAHGEGSSKAVHGTGNPERIEAFNTPGANRAMSNGCINVNGQTVCFDVLQKGSGMYILPEQSKQLVLPNSFFIPRTNSEGKPTIFKKGGMLKRADGSYSRRGLWDNIRAAAARNKLAGKSGKKPTSEMLAQEKKINNTYRTGGQFPRPYSLPEDSFKQGGRDLHNSVYASSNAQYPAVYNFGGTLKNNLATRQQMYMPLDHITRNGGSILSMSNTPELSGEGKDLTVPENSYYYANGGSMEEPWLHNLYPNGGGLFQRWRNRNNPGITTNLT